MKSRFTYFGESVIEVVVNGDSLTWNVLQDAAAAPVAPPQEAPPPVFPPVPAAAPVAELPSAPVLDEVEAPMTLAAAPERPQEAVSEAPQAEAVSSTVAAPLTPKRRSLMGFIRATWFVVFSVTGEVVTYLLDNLTTLNLPPGTGVAVGAALYGVKRGIFPDTTL